MVRRFADDTLPEISCQDIELDVECLTSGDKPIATIRKETALSKVPQCVSFIKDTLLETDKVVVFFYHREVAEKLQYELSKYKPLLLIGGLASYIKNETINNFRKSERKVFLLQINCAEGIDGLQHESHVGIFVEQEWSPSIVKQAVGRLNRSGQKHPVLIYNLILRNSIESHIEKVLQRKEKIIGELV